METIKKPYKELIHWLLASPVHVLICGRQGNDFAEDERSGELKNVGFKMRAQRRDSLRTDVLIRMESHKASRKETAVPLAHVEKDRSGILAGQSIPWPAFDNIAKPLWDCSGRRSPVPTDDEVGQQDAECLARQEMECQERSAELAAEYTRTLRPSRCHRCAGEAGQAIDAGGQEPVDRQGLARVRRRAYATRLGNSKRRIPLGRQRSRPKRHRQRHRILKTRNAAVAVSPTEAPLGLFAIRWRVTRSCRLDARGRTGRYGAKPGRSCRQRPATGRVTELGGGRRCIMVGRITVGNGRHDR